MAQFIIGHLEPELMNLNADAGNLICLQKRVTWYGHEGIIKNISLQDDLDIESLDMLFMGNGSMLNQIEVANRLKGHAEKLKTNIEKGLPVLFIAAAYQLLGDSWQNSDGAVIKGAGIFRFTTDFQSERLTGNIAVNIDIAGDMKTVVGFENHPGRTIYQDKNLKSFGSVIKGHGNNGEDKSEGIWYKNVIGTYIHGPLLAKNPHVADYFIRTMAERKGVVLENTLDDSWEWFAHRQIIKKMKLSKV